MSHVTKPFAWWCSVPAPLGRLVWMLLFTACAGHDPAVHEPEPEGDAGQHVAPFNGDCSRVAVPTFSELSSGIFSHCVVCHAASLSGDARNGSPENVNFDNYDDAKAMASFADRAVRGHIMPFPKGAGVTDAERNQLYEWAECGTPP